MDFIIQGFFQSIKLIVSMDEETLNIVFTTLSLTGFSMLIILAIGLPLGFVLGYFDFRGKHILRTVVDTLLALPTVVVGLLVYAFISRRGPLGNFELLYHSGNGNRPGHFGPSYSNLLYSYSYRGS